MHEDEASKSSETTTPQVNEQVPSQPVYPGYQYPYPYYYGAYPYYYGYNMTQPFYYTNPPAHPQVLPTATYPQPFGTQPYAPTPNKAIVKPSEPTQNPPTTSAPPRKTFASIRQESIRLALQNVQKRLEKPLSIFRDEGNETNDSTSTAEKDKKSIPKSLRDYVHRCFDACSNDSEKDRLEGMIRDFLRRVIGDGSAFTTNWQTVPIIRYNGKLPSAKREKPSKRNSLDKLMLEKKKFKKSRLRKAKAQNQNQNQNQDDDSSLIEIKKFERQQRFDAKPLIFNREIEIQNPRDKIVGMSTLLEKPYLRLTTAPDPMTVRPLNILVQSYQHVMNCWEKTRNYQYISEQLKSIRQDLTIQGIRDEFCIKVYEENARIALSMKDRDEFNQCQTCLKQLYKEGLKGNELEFIVYNILYLTYTKNHLEMANLLSTLSEANEKQESICLAIKLYIAYKDSNFLKFFNIYRKMIKMPNAVSLIQLFIDTPRIAGLKSIISSFSPRVPQEYVRKLLGFSDLIEFQSWLKDRNINFEIDKDLDCKSIRSMLYNM
ncbi:THP3 C2A9.11c [Thelohanellus kitauei]|uniref:THP3 C2A9.11c n=1 Tax=Thelohanellus kitauei TaxID=669202 RepID=A0A0C2I699_THEKT|nr:THP3 C2A9.11c [Thelohanellus kitauei]